jgi:hypothetical protein
MNINNILDDIIEEISTLKSTVQSTKLTTTYIPSFKLDDVRNKYKIKLYDYLLGLLEQIRGKQMQYDSCYYSTLIKRKEYVTSTLTRMKNELENAETFKLKNLKSQIDFIKDQGDTQFDKIIINRENSLKIFNYLSKIDLVEEFKWMEDFLKRKVVFEVDIPIELEVINLKKMVNLLEINNSGSSV